MHPLTALTEIGLSDALDVGNAWTTSACRMCVALKGAAVTGSVQQKMEKADVHVWSIVQSSLIVVTAVAPLQPAKVRIIALRTVPSNPINVAATGIAPSMNGAIPAPGHPVQSAMIA